MQRRSAQNEMSLGRPTETAAHRIGLYSFGLLAVVFLGTVPLLWTGDGGEYVRGLGCLGLGFGGLFAVMALHLWLTRPDTTVIDFAGGNITTDETSIRCADISSIEISLERQEQGRFSFARWYVRAFVGDSKNPIVIARNRDLTDVYPGVHRLVATTGMDLTFRGVDVTRVARPTEVRRDRTERQYGESEVVSWTYLNGWAIVFGLFILALFLVVLDPAEAGALSRLPGAVVVAGIFSAGLYHFTRELSVPFGQGRYEVECNGEEVLLSRFRSTHRWSVDRIDYIVRRDAFWHGVLVLGDDVARLLPCNGHSIAEVHKVLCSGCSGDR